MTSAWARACRCRVRSRRAGCCSTAPLEDFLFDPDFLYVIGVTGNGQVMAIDLDARRRLATLELSGLPRPGAGVRWEHEGRTLLALPNLREGVVSVIDEARWELVKSIATRGPGFFLASHERSPYLWGDVFFGPHQDVLHLIDKQSLEIVHTLRPEPGKRAAHVAFSADGKHALVSIWEEEGALVVYDSASLEEIKRIPMSRPTGKYWVAPYSVISAPADGSVLGIRSSGPPMPRRNRSGFPPRRRWR
jgi:hypothetical protein